MTITPLKNRVLLRPFVPKINPGEIVLGEDKFSLKKFVVVSKGEEVEQKISVGDVVLSELGYIISEGNEKFTIVDEGDIVAVLS